MTGAPRLAELLDEGVVRKISQWLDLAWATGASRGSRQEEPEEFREAPWPDPLEEAAFHGPAGEFVRLVGPHTEADPAGLLVQVLVAFGNLVGRGPYFRVERTQHFGNLFVSLVGISSKGRKGTSFDHAIALLRTLDEAWARERQLGGLSSGEGLIWAVRDPTRGRNPIREKGGRIVEYQEVEVEAGVADKRLLVYQPELATALRVMCRDGSTLSPTVRQAWDNGNLAILNKNSPARATDAHISIIGHITDVELRRYLDRTELANGFANRILWVCVRRARVLPEGGRIDTVDFAPLIKRLSDALLRCRAMGATRMTLSEEARSRWHEVYPTLSEGKPGLAGAVVSRAEAQTVRLALVYALLDGSSTIELCHLEAALAVWRYAEQSAEFIFGSSLGDPTADRIHGALRRAGGAGMRRTEISSLLGRNAGGAEIERALLLLAKYGLVRRATEETAGRPGERWFATNPYERNEKSRESPLAESGGSDTFSPLNRFFRTEDQVGEGGLRGEGENRPNSRSDTEKIAELGLDPEEWDVVQRPDDSKEEE